MNDEELRSFYRRLLSARASEDPSRDRCVHPEQLAQLSDGSASEDDRLRWMDHVSTCLMCMEDLAVLRATADAGRQFSSRKRMATWWAMAASIAAIGFATALWRGGTRQPDIMRGGTGGVTLISPVGLMDTPGTAVDLVWRATPRAIRYDVEIVDPAGSAVYARTVKDTIAPLTGDTNLRPNTRYRWRVTALLSDGSRLRSPAESFEIRR